MDDSKSRHPYAVVTGPTSGFGRAAAEHLAMSGFDLCLVARDQTRAERVAEQLRRHQADSGRVVRIDIVVADLSSISEVDRAGREIASSGRPIELLLNNAGAVFGLRRRESVDGLELTMALNHLGYVGLTRHLLAAVAASRGRVVNVASDAYEFAGDGLDFDAWMAGVRYRPHRQYGRSKLANIIFTRGLAARAPDGVDVVAWSPRGLTATRSAYGAHRLAPLAMKLTHPFSLKTEDAVRSLLDLCERPLADDEQGAFFVDRQIDPVEFLTAANVSSLWEMSEALIDEKLASIAARVF